MTESKETATFDAGEKAVELLAGILDRMKLPAKVSVVQASEEKLILDIECEKEDDTQRVIGRRGQVVDSLQHLVGKMLVKASGERGRPVVVDCGGYRQKQIERLEGLATRMADKARETGEAVELSPMTAHDRRIVHMTIKEIEGVATRSEGEGEDRHVVVYPE